MSKNAIQKYIRYLYAYPSAACQLSIALLQAETENILFCNEKIAIPYIAESDDHWNIDATYSQLTQLLFLPININLKKSIALNLAFFMQNNDMHFWEVVKSYGVDRNEFENRRLIFLQRWTNILLLAGGEADKNNIKNQIEKLSDLSIVENLYNQLPAGNRIPYLYNEKSPSGTID
jgi:Golgi nucleoside diphosphatase